MSFVKIMILKTQNRCAKNTLLPFNLTRGNVKERNANAWKYWGKFLDNFLQNDECSVDTFRSSIDKALEPYKINYEILPEKSFSSLGFTGVNISVLPHSNGGLYIERIGYKIGLPISLKDKKTIYNDTTAVHEARHFFEYLFQPKSACIRAKELVNNPNSDDDVEKLREVVLKDFSSRFNKKHFTQKVESILNKLPDNVAIEILQKLRYSLKAEYDAMSSEIKYLARQNPIKNFSRILNTFVLRQFCSYKAKDKIITSKLKNLLAKARSEIKVSVGN